MNNQQAFITLNDGNKIPQLGIGTFMIHGDAATEQACLTALKSGYRHIDTAHAYYNEGGVGQAVRKSGIPREEIWITSKLWPNEYGEGLTLKAIDQMLKRLDTDYIDLLLLHQPHGDYIGAWRDMEKAVKAGKVRSIGLSNFERKFDEVARIATIKPAVIQVECHPYYPQHQLKEHVAAYGTRLESWYPLGHADRHLLNEPVFSKLAKKYGKSNVQIILRWHIQEGNIVFPKSTNPEHIQSNMDIFDFELTDEEMNEIKALDKNQRFYPMS
ncbi:MAG: aldo/keto reductase [Prevotella sp.]|jgi:diketogulonate reductase-like aldo/keto reductase